MSLQRRRGAFDPTRLDDLDDLLPPVPPIAAPVTLLAGPPDPVTTHDLAAMPSPDADPTRPPARPSGKAKGARRPEAGGRAGTAMSEPAPGSRVSVAVYVPDDLKALLEQRQAQRGRNVSYAQIGLEALAARVEEIDRRLQQDREAAAVVRARSSSSRFVPPPVRQQSLRGPGGRQVQLRLTVEEVAWLDGVRAELGAYSRSAVIALALELELAPTRQATAKP